MLSVIALSVITLSVIILSVFMLSAIIKSITISVIKLNAIMMDVLAPLAGDRFLKRVECEQPLGKSKAKERQVIDMVSILYNLLK